MNARGVPNGLLEPWITTTRERIHSLEVACLDALNHLPPDGECARLIRAALERMPAMGDPSRRCVLTLHLEADSPSELVGVLDSIGARVWHTRIQGPTQNTGKAFDYVYCYKERDMPPPRSEHFERLRQAFEGKPV
jgi:hypothetical protein